MFVLVKYIVTAILRKPLRSALMLLTICISGAAIFASVSLSDTMIKTSENQWRSEYGYADLLVKANPASPSRYVNPYKSDSFGNNFAYKVLKLSAGAKVSGVPFVVHGYTLATLRKMLELPLLETLDLEPFAGNKIIVSAKYAGEHGVKAGDTLTAVIQGNRHQFVVAAICPKAGPFAYESDTYAAVIPFEKMQSCLGKLGKADTLYISLLDTSQKSRLIVALSEVYKGYTVSETYSADHIRLQTGRSAVPFVFMSVLLCMMAVYVIYVIFQNIVVERMPLMGIFQAMGAAKPAADAVILMEGAAYGVLGGILSIGAGAFALSMMVKHLTAAEYAAAITLHISPWHALLAFFTCAVISVLGGCLSLIKYKNHSVIDLIRQSTAAKAASRNAAPVFASALLLSAILFLALWRSQSGLAVYVALVAVIILSFLMASPFLYGLFSMFAKKLAIKADWFIRLVSLSIQNQRGFAVAATIVSVIVATTMIIETIQYSDEEGSREYFQRFHYDLELASNDLTRGRINFLEQLPGVKGVCPNFYSGNIDVKGKSISIYRVHGIDTRKAPQFMDYDVISSSPAPFETLENGKNILLTKTLGNIYGVHESDIIVLKIFGHDGIFREIAYTVIGFFNDEYTKLGRYALISKSNFAEDFKAKAYSTVYLETDDPEAASSAIESAFRDKQYTLTRVLTMQRDAKEESSQVISAMGWISSLSAFTGILCMLFVISLSIKNRKGELAVYFAMGQDKGGIFVLLIAEAILSGLAGLMAGCLMGTAISRFALPRLIESLQIAMSIRFSPAIPLHAGLYGLLYSAVSGMAGAAGFFHTTVMGGLKSE